MKVIIAGAGFAGLRLARKLNNRRGVEVVLLDRYNYHQFQPLFYQVATSGLDASNISFPLRKVFQKSKNVHIRMASLLKVDSRNNSVETDLGSMEYDVLVLALGADSNFFNNSTLQANSFAMKSTVEALQIRHRLLQNFEDALQAKDEEERKKLMTVVIVGGGPTGVELSGAVAEMKHYVLPKDYPELDFSEMKIYLLEGSDRTLAGMSAKSSADSASYLQKLGVTLMTNTIVQDYDGDTVTLKDGNNISSAMVIWAAGIKGNVPAGIDPALVVRGNRIRVNEKNAIPASPNIFVLGDLAYMETAEYPKGHPQVAPVAMQQADLLARNLMSGLAAEQWKNFKYHDKGSMATVGRNLAVVDLPKPRLHFRGFPAWMIWMGLHLMLILGVKNRLFVFLNWLYNYITYDQSLRLIFREFYRPLPDRKQRVAPHAGKRVMQPVDE